LLNINDVIIAKLTNGLPQRRDRFAAGNQNTDWMKMNSPYN
jgi:hypothetical protein